MHPIRPILLVFTCSLVLAAQGQVIDGQFGDMSAKERSRIAKAEEEGASNDSAFQALMTHADNLFREQRFEEALERFIEARDLRPYNVYPRVKIQDLQALIAKREEQAGSTTAPVPAVPEPQKPSVDPASAKEEPLVPVEPMERVAPMEQKVADTPARKVPVAPVEAPTPVQRPVPPKQSTPRTQEVSAPVAEGERIYKEGRAVVVERTATVEGKAVIYRKVLHPWGEMMYFRDGASVPERAWAEVFGAQ